MELTAQRHVRARMVQNVISQQANANVRVDGKETTAGKEPVLMIDMEKIAVRLVNVQLKIPRSVILLMENASANQGEIAVKKKYL